MYCLKKNVFKRTETKCSNEKLQIDHFGHFGSSGVKFLWTKEMEPK